MHPHVRLLLLAAPPRLRHASSRRGRSQDRGREREREQHRPAVGGCPGGRGGHAHRLRSGVLRAQHIQGVPGVSRARRGSHGPRGPPPRHHQLGGARAGELRGARGACAPGRHPPRARLGVHRPTRQPLRQGEQRQQPHGHPRPAGSPPGHVVLGAVVSGGPHCRWRRLQSGGPCDAGGAAQRVCGLAAARASRWPARPRAYR
mmetsp:Transcript_37612/g.88983  ORF Transcript_37612/g.88983 Transcript_37612/m.88983 type:complete len:203 (-) Transcript_37612:959-1567(-)